MTKVQQWQNFCCKKTSQIYCKIKVKFGIMSKSSWTAFYRSFILPFLHKEMNIIFVIFLSIRKLLQLFENFKLPKTWNNSIKSVSNLMRRRKLEFWVVFAKMCVKSGFFAHYFRLQNKTVLLLFLLLKKYLKKKYF